MPAALPAPPVFLLSRGALSLPVASFAAFVANGAGLEGVLLVGRPLLRASAAPLLLALLVPRGATLLTAASWRAGTGALLLLLATARAVAAATGLRVHRTQVDLLPAAGRRLPAGGGCHR